MRQVTKRPGARIGLAVGAAAVVLVLGVAAGAFYVFGGVHPGQRTSSGGPAGVPTLVATKNGTVFTIDPSATEASFTIDEVLFGSPNTVVGKTSKVTGQILIDPQDPAQSRVGTIRVDLSTLATDNDLRNQTLRNRILQTSDPANQYATFVARSYAGLPSSIAVGQTVSFQIIGDLTIHQVTRSVTFVTRVTAVSETRITGQAQTTVIYADFGIPIPNVPTVTSVSNDVKLAITFSAHA